MSIKTGIFIQNGLPALSACLVSLPTLFAPALFVSLVLLVAAAKKPKMPLEEAALVASSLLFFRYLRLAPLFC
jgi:hypothetical protein